jgi:6-phosphogluconolactonase
VPANQVLTIKEGLPVGQAAVHYAGQLLELSSTVLPRTADNLPIIDCVLLGMGPDGHVASLFPNRKETAATGELPLPSLELPPLHDQSSRDGHAGLAG